MPLLLKDEIRKLAEDPGILLLGQNFQAQNLESCSYDLRVGSIFKGKEIFSEQLLKPDEKNIIELKPSEIVTLLTLEEVNLPSNIYGTVFAMNRFSSRGFLILNPGHIDPGYKGPISICAINLSKDTVALQIGKTKIFTIIFDRLEKDAEAFKNDEKFLALDRKGKDEYFSIDRSRKLSTSFFDLIKVHEYKDHLEKVLWEIFLKRFWRIVIGIGVIVGLVVGAIKLGESFFPKKSIKNENVRPVDSVGIFKKQNDSLIALINALNKKIIQDSGGQNRNKKN